VTTLWTLEAAARFWEAAGEPAPGFPRDLRLAVAHATPLAVVDLPRLGIAAMARWLGARRCNAPVDLHDRPLRAALYAGSEGGWLFLDGADPDDERRFSLAHEVAHFIVEYVEPRRRVAARLGPRVLEVLDGRRRPAEAERIDAALTGLRLQPRLHLLERTETGLPRAAAVTQAEARADELALELLAPIELVQQLQPGGVARSALAVWLAATFGLPAEAAAAYARQFAPAERHAFRDLLRVPGAAGVHEESRE
jgi:hypothetical protein